MFTGLLYRKKTMVVDVQEVNAVQWVLSAGFFDSCLVDRTIACPLLALYILKHLNISGIIYMSSGVLWPLVLISDLQSSRVEHFIAMSTSQLPKWPSLLFCFTWFSKIENRGNCTVSGEKGLPPFQIVDDCDLLIKLWFMLMKKVNIGQM